MGEERSGGEPEKSPPNLVEERDAILRWLRRRKRRLEKRRESLREEYEEAATWEKKQQEAELLRAHLSLLKRGMKEIELDDWWAPGEKRAIALNPAYSPREEIERRFKAAKKAKRKLPHFSALLGKMDEEEIFLNQAMEAGEEIATDEALEAWKTAVGSPQQPSGTIRHREKDTRKPYRAYHSQAGLTILVGKQAADNEVLTFQVGRGNDWWLHVADYPGSHVVIRVDKGIEVDGETLQDAMLLALHFSKARHASAAEITVTQVKYVHRFPGANPGQVHVSQHRRQRVRWDQSRWDRLSRHPKAAS